MIILIDSFSQYDNFYIFNINGTSSISDEKSSGKVYKKSRLFYIILNNIQFQFSLLRI